MDLKTTYNRIAQDWFKDHKESDWWHKYALEFLGFLKKGDKILDVACGPGMKAKFFIEQGFDVTGFDFSEEMIKLAKQNCPEGKFFVRDMNNPLDLGMFDGIFAQAALLHTPKSEMVAVIKNLLGNLKEKGYFYLALKESKPNEKDEQIIKENDYGYDYERFFSFFTLDEICNYFTELNLKIISQNKVKKSHTTWVVVIAQKVV